MSDDRMKMPPERDFGFYQRRKHDKWRAVPLPEPALEGPVADSHAHIHMLPDPGWELARCAANGVDFVCMITDPSEDGSRPFDELDSWQREGATQLVSGAQASAPTSVCVAVGVHPHNARLYDDAIEAVLLRRLSDSRVAALGEIGLDYHYDLSPRDAQREVFRRQIQLAKEAGLPIALHLRGGDDAERDNAHREAFDILQEAGFPEKGTLLHCCALSPRELVPWIEAGCHIAYGGAITFKKSDDAREGARIVPEDRLLIETDSPYMAPEPMRGTVCTPAHVIYTAVALAELKGAEPGEARRAFFAQIHENTLAFYTRR